MAKKGKVLVAEDEKKILNLLQLYLEKNNYDVITAENGKEALEKIKRYSPDLLVLDIMMPAMNGHEVCKKIRKNRKYKDIPIIYLSSLTEKQSIISSLEIGGDDYMTKPFDPNELIARINAILRRVKGRYISSEREDRMEELTFQEQKILQYMEEGYTNKEIAFNLALTERTVKVYNHIIYQKLQVKNRTQAIVRAKELNII